MTAETFELMADVLPEPMLFVTASGSVIGANETMRQMLGASFVKGQTYNVSEIFKTPKEEIDEYLRLCSGVRQFVPGSLKLRFYSAEEVDLRCEGAGIHDGTSSESQVMLRLKPKLAAVDRFRWLNEQIDLLNHEIGERIKLEEERKCAEMELKDSLSREKEARRSAEAASRAKDDFLASLSHELRTPLNPVLLIASDAADNPELPREVRNNFESIRKNIELEARLIDDLLDLTRINHGKLLLHSCLIDAQVIVQEAIANVQSEVNEKQIQMILNWEAPDAMVHGDAVRLQQVFWNVLKNAVKFTPPKGKIIVATTISNGQLSIDVTDSGIGMTREEIGRIFNAFSQGDHAGSASHRFGGLGLGLAISHRLLELHSGKIHAHSAGHNQGATFIVELPLAKKNKNELLMTESTAENGLAIPKSSRNSCILLIEDHEPTRNVLAHLLNRRQYKVLVAGSAAEAREISAKEKIDIVISDIGLPDGNGNDLMKELQQRFGLRGIALTGYGMEQDVERSLASGFVTHLIKPVNVRSLENALESFAS